MTDKQIEEKLQVIEDKTPQLFKQHKLKDHITWAAVEGTDKLTWRIHDHFAGNLPSSVKLEVSKLMNPLTKSGYTIEKVEE